MLVICDKGQKLTGVDRWLSLLGPLSRGASQFKSLANLATRIDKAKDSLTSFNK